MSKDFELHDYSEIKEYNYAGQSAYGHSFVFKARTKKTDFTIKGNVFSGELPEDVSIHVTRGAKTKIVYPKWGTRFDDLMDRVSKETKYLGE